MSLDTDPRDHLERLYNQNREGIYIYLLRTVRNPDLALDLMQDTFLNFFRYFAEKGMPDELSSRKILYRISHNLAVNHFNKAGTVREISIEGEFSGPDSHEQEITDRLHKEDLENLLQELLARLPPEQRTAVILKYYQGFRLEDIAAILGVSAATVSRMIKKGVRKLTEMYEIREKK